MNIQTLKTDALPFIRKNIWIILSILALSFQIYQINFHPNSIRFAPKVIDGFFTLFAFNTPFFVLFFLLLRKNIWKCFAISQIFGAIVMYVLWNRYLDQYYIINSLMDNVFVRYLLPFNFIIASIKDGSQLWSFMISFYAGVILLIYGNWFIKNKKLKDGYWKIERQVIWTGIGVYGIINVLIWMFTHFSFVGGNYLYMETTIKYVDQIVTIYDKNGQKDHFSLKDLKYFETRQEMIDYYKNPLFMQAAGVVDRQGFYDVSMDIMGKFNTDKPGHSIDNNLSYKNMVRFHDWMSVVMNMKYLGEDTTQKTAWTIELAPIIRVDPKYQDVTRHAIMYVKQSKDGHFYSYFVFDRVFKDFKQNYIFNLFFGLFHVVFIPMFIYLVYLHKRKNLQKSAIVKEMKDLD